MKSTEAESAHKIKPANVGTKDYWFFFMKYRLIQNQGPRYIDRWDIRTKIPVHVEYIHDFN